MIDTVRGLPLTDFLWEHKGGVKPSHAMDPETREAAIQDHIKRIRSDPRWKPELGHRFQQTEPAANAKLDIGKARYVKFVVAPRYYNIRRGRRQRFMRAVARKVGVHWKSLHSIIMGHSWAWLKEE